MARQADHIVQVKSVGALNTRTFSQSTTVNPTVEFASATDKTAVPRARGNHPMSQALRVLYPSHHHLHRPRTFIEFGQGKKHLDGADRIDVMLSAVSQMTGVTTEGTSRVATTLELTSVHGANFVQFFLRSDEILASDPEAELVPDTFPFGHSSRLPKWHHAQLGLYCFDLGTPIGHHTVQAALESAGCAIVASERLLAESDGGPVYALCRPPGHHACKSRYGGFCYLNNCALAVSHLSMMGRIGILDLDYHHGNGTQDIFYASKRVLYASIHGDPNQTFPYFSGYPEETGEREGKGYNLNYPLPYGSSSSTYLATLSKALEQIALKNCQVLVVSIGYDAVRSDPFGAFDLGPQEYFDIGHLIRSLNLPTLVLQEGGYDLAVLGDCASHFVGGLLS